jgi:hypothetical protein
MGAANRRESLGQQEVAGETRPDSLACTDHHINAFTFQVHHVGRNVEAYRVLRVKQLKAAKTRR